MKWAALRVLLLRPTTVIQGGDFTNGDGTGGKSIYGNKVRVSRPRERSASGGGQLTHLPMLHCGRPPVCRRELQDPCVTPSMLQRTVPVLVPRS